MMRLAMRLWLWQWQWQCIIIIIIIICGLVAHSVAYEEEWPGEWLPRAGGACLGRYLQVIKHRKGRAKRT